MRVTPITVNHTEGFASIHGLNDNDLRLIQSTLRGISVTETDYAEGQELDKTIHKALNKAAELKAAR